MKSSRISGVIAVLVVGLVGVSAVDAFRPDQAMVHITKGQVQTMASQVVTCDADHPVGVFVDRGAMMLGGVVDGGCEVGVWTAARATVRQVEVRQVTQIGLFITGFGGTVTQNSCVGAGVCFLVTGHNNLLQDNRAEDASLAAYAVGGFNNIIRRNLARRTHYGINIGSTIYRFGDVIAFRGDGTLGTPTPEMLFAGEDFGSQNLIEDNTIEDAVVALKDYPERVLNNCDPEFRVNGWRRNIFDILRRDLPCLE